MRHAFFLRMILRVIMFIVSSGIIVSADDNIVSLVDGAQMVWIEGGTFEMGRNDGNNDEKPIHTVTVDGFYIDIHEVTNAQYRQFIQATGHAEPRYYWNKSEYNQPNQPVGGVTWYDAMAYAKWAGKRLPTEAEWEYAARGGLNGKKYPWGDVSPDHTKANYSTNEARLPSPVGSYFPNGYGLYDMAGNVEEWCLDEYDEDFYANSPSLNPVGGSQNASDIIESYRDISTMRVLRGGSWGYDNDGLLVAFRNWSPPVNWSFSFGFRCVVRPSELSDNGD